MQNTAQDLNIYFKGLKKKVHIKNFYQFLIFTAFIQSSIYFTHMLVLQNIFDGKASPIQYQSTYYIIFYMSIFICFFFWFSITIRPDTQILKNKDSVNLYNALKYLHRNQQNKMSEDDFIKLIDSLYEKERLQEIILNINTDKDIYAKDTENINNMYANKEKIVSAESILKREFLGI